MKKYKVVKAWPGVEVGTLSSYESDTYWFDDYDFDNKEIIQMLKEGWIEEVSDRKTLKEKMHECIETYYEGHYNRDEYAAKIAKDHYLGLLDEAVEKWHKDRVKGAFDTFLRKYLESEGKI